MLLFCDQDEDDRLGIWYELISGGDKDRGLRLWVKS